MRFSRSTHLPKCLSLETLRSIIRTGQPIPVELIDLVNSVIIFLSHMTLLRWLTFLLGSLTLTLTVLLFWIYLFLMTLVSVRQWLSLHLVILIMFLSQFPLTTFRQTNNGIPRFIAYLIDQKKVDLNFPWPKFSSSLENFVTWADK